MAASGDVEDGTVDDQVDGQVWVGTIVRGELGRCEVYGSFLRGRHVSFS